MIERMNQYAFWQDSLAGKQPQIVNEMPQPGFYRVRRGPLWAPVAVFLDKNGKLCFKFGREIVDRHVGIEQWPYYAAHAITEAEYRKVAEQGGNWSDADPVVAEMLSATKTAPDATEAASDATADMRSQIDTALAGVSAYSKIETDEADVRALSLRNLLNELASTADKTRKEQKEPFLKAEREVDTKWMPLVEQARAGAQKIKIARDQWQDDKRAAAKAATVAAEAATRAQEEAHAHRDISEPMPEPVKPVSNLPLPSVSVKPTYGRASGVGTKMVVTAVDYDKFFAALKTRPEWPTVKDQFDEWAQKLANKGIIPDGVTAEERANTR
jgi:hypothetical protein